MIKAQALTRNYGGVTAVDNVSFEIGSKEIVGLLGHNGAGKTTIMKMITGYLEPSSGTVSIDGVDVWSDRSAAQRRLGYLPENCPLYPEMSVLEYLDYAAVLRGVSDSQKSERLCYVLERANLAGVALKPIATLSRGYKQRLGVASALLNSPRLLILDEPTNGLDPSQINDMRVLIKELAQAATVVLSTHILQEVQAVCSRVIIVNNGKVALDAGMDSLQIAGRIRVLTDGQPELFGRLLAELSGTRLVQHRRQNSHHEYIVDTQGEQFIVSINRALVNEDCNVYAIHPVVRDLESIFGEIVAAQPASIAAVEPESSGPSDASTKAESSAEEESATSDNDGDRKKHLVSSAKEEERSNE